MCKVFSTFVSWNEVTEAQSTKCPPFGAWGRTLGGLHSGMALRILLDPTSFFGFHVVSFIDKVLLYSLGWHTKSCASAP